MRRTHFAQPPAAGEELHLPMRRTHFAQPPAAGELHLLMSRTHFAPRLASMNPAQTAVEQQ